MNALEKLKHNAEQIARLAREREAYNDRRDFDPLSDQQAGEEWALSATWAEIDHALTIGKAYFKDQVEPSKLLSFVTGVQKIAGLVGSGGR